MRIVNPQPSLLLWPIHPGNALCGQRCERDDGECIATHLEIDMLRRGAQMYSGAHDHDGGCTCANTREGVSALDAGDVGRAYYEQVHI